MTNSFPLKRNAFKARALLVGERIDLKGWRTVDNLASNPITVEVKGGGTATLHRYGVVVFFDVTPAEEVAFLANLRPLVANPYATPANCEVQKALEAKIEFPGIEEARKILAAG